MSAAECDRWQSALDQAVGESGFFQSALVLEEVASTQTSAREHALGPGSLVTALRQRAGQGRLGRTWADTDDEGLAVTFVVEPEAPERLAIASAIAAARAIEAMTGVGAGIKWPNDLILEDHKVGGILIERDDQRALIGIGINVAQSRWPAELADIAVSLLQCGCQVDRLVLLTALVRSLQDAIGLEEGPLAEAFARRDVLIGSQGTFLCRGELVAGRVLGVDPLQGLRVQTAEGREKWLPAAVTSVQRWARRSDKDGRATIARPGGGNTLSR